MHCEARNHPLPPCIPFEVSARALKPSGFHHCDTYGAAEPSTTDAFSAVDTMIRSYAQTVLLVVVSTSYTHKQPRVQVHPENQQCTCSHVSTSGAQKMGRGGTSCRSRQRALPMAMWWVADALKINYIIITEDGPAITEGQGTARTYIADQPLERVRRPEVVEVLGAIIPVGRFTAHAFLLVVRQIATWKQHERKTQVVAVSGHTHTNTHTHTHTRVLFLKHMPLFCFLPLLSSTLLPSLCSAPFSFVYSMRSIV